MFFNQPQFFDIFGAIGFVYIILFSVWCLKNNRVVPGSALFVLLMIGVVGFLVDSAIVYFSYIRS